MNISASMVSELRERTGAGILAAKNALTEAGGDMEQAMEILKKAGGAKAAKRAQNTTGEGLVYSYIHSTGKLGVMVELQCETDFVARTDAFKELAHQLAMHIAATDPQYLDEAGIAEDEMAREREAFAQEARATGKPDAIVDKIVQGRIDTWLGEQVLMRQAFVMDEEQTIEQVLREAIVRIGENIRLTRFTRFNIEGGMRACQAKASVPVV